MTVLTLSADERARRARLSAFTGILVQGVAIITGIISVPLTVSYLGPERYGVWLTLNSALMWLYLGQMGLGGNALVTRLSRALTANDERAAAELVSTSFFALAGAAAAIGLLLAAFGSGLDWRIVFNTSSQVREGELGLAVTFSLALFLTLFPSSVIEAVFVAHHEGYIANAWSLAANLLSFVGLVYAVSVKATLPWLVVGVFGARVVAASAAGTSLFIRRPGLTPRLGTFSLLQLRALGNLGVRYLVAQLTSMGMFQSQPFIVSQIIGPSAVGIFAVAQRLLTLPLMLTQTIANAHVAAFSDAFSRGETEWLRKTLARSTAVAGLAAAGTLLVLGFLARPIIRIWAGPSLVPDPWLVTWLSLYVAVACMVTPASSALYATERVGRQAIYGIANACLTVILGIIFTLRWGLPGLGAAMFVALAVVNPVAQWRELRAAGILGTKETKS